MKFGLFTSPYRYGDLELAFKDAADFGYDYIELWGGRPHAYSIDLINGRVSLERLVDKYGIPVRVYTPEHNDYPFNYMLGNEAQWEEVMSYFETGIKAAKMLGCEYMLVSIGHGRLVPYEQNWHRLIKSLNRIAEYAEKEEQKIVVETLTQYESNICTTLPELIRALNSVNSAFLYPMLDLVPPFVQDENPADYVRYFKERLTHLHLIDSDGVSETHLVPGDGVMDLRKILNEICSLGFDGTATIELVTHYISNPSYYAELALKKAKELFQ